MLDYKIPQEIKSKIPSCFYYALLGELCGVFGSKVFDYDEDGNMCLYYLEGTAGWGAALYMTCRKLSIDWLWEYYESLEWDDSDLFDSEISDEIVKEFEKRFEGEFVNDANDYYLWILEEMKGEEHDVDKWKEV